MAAMRALLGVSVLLLLTRPCAGSADELTFSSFRQYDCRASFADGRFVVHYAIDWSACAARAGGGGDAAATAATTASEQPADAASVAGLKARRERRRTRFVRNAAERFAHLRRGGQRGKRGDGGSGGRGRRLDEDTTLTESMRADQAARWALKRANVTASHVLSAFAAQPTCAGATISIALVVEFRGEAAAAARQRGWWVAFGLAEAGGLRGADLVRYDSRSAKLTDAHTARTAEMVPDTQQDWSLESPVNATWVARAEGDGGAALLRVTVRLRRTLATTDARYDHPFTADGARPAAPTRVLGLWGVGRYEGEAAAAATPVAVGGSDGVARDEGGLAHHVRGTLRLLARCSADPFVALRRDPAVARVEVRVLAHAVETRVKGWGVRRTEAHTYACFNIEAIRGLGGRRFSGHVVGVRAVLSHDGGGERSPLRHLTALGYRHRCPDEGRGEAGLAPEALEPAALEPLYFWAPGAAPLVLPADAGIRLGGRSGYRALVLKLWYEPWPPAPAPTAAQAGTAGPEMVGEAGGGVAANGGDGAGRAAAAAAGGGGLGAPAAGAALAALAESASGSVLDSSGVTLFVTHAHRAYDAGLMALGDGELGLVERRLPLGNSSFKFSCPAECSYGHYGGKTLFVYARAMHMRGHGERIATTMRGRNGSVARNDAINYFDSRALGAAEPLLHGGAGFRVEPGSSFSTVCSYTVAEPGSAGLNGAARGRRMSRSHVAFGHGSSKEACVDYVYYYPQVRGVQSCGPLRPTSKMVKIGRISAAVFLPHTAQQEVQPGGEGGCHGRFSRLTRHDSQAEMRRGWGIEPLAHVVGALPGLRPLR